MDGSSHPPQLDYALRQPLNRRIAKRAGWVLLSLLVSFFFVYVGPIEWRNLQLVRLQNQCLRYQPPADQAIWSSSKQIKVTSSEWFAFYSLLSPSGPLTEATLFLHERISPGGHRRLVYVGGTAGQIKRTTPHDVLMPATRVFVLGSAIHPPREIWADSLWTITASSDFFAGQPDPDNASHFTIRTSNTIYDGWLRDDDTVLIEPRTAPLLPSPAR